MPLTTILVFCRSHTAHHTQSKWFRDIDWYCGSFHIFFLLFIHSLPRIRFSQATEKKTNLQNIKIKRHKQKCVQNKDERIWKQNSYRARERDTQRSIGSNRISNGNNLLKFLLRRTHICYKCRVNAIQLCTKGEPKIVSFTRHSVEKVKWNGHNSVKEFHLLSRIEHAFPF